MRCRGQRRRAAGVRAIVRLQRTMPKTPSVLIEGLTVEEILALPPDHLRELTLNGKPVAFRVGTATVLGQFSVETGTLTTELAHIEGGGEGALPTIASLASQYARSAGLSRIEWLVYATNCARPNPKLRRVLVRRGFRVETRDGKGECYFRANAVE